MALSAFWVGVCCGASLTGLFAAIPIWRLFRRTRYLRAALRRQRQRHIKTQNDQQLRDWYHLRDTVVSLCETFSRAPAPTLNDLANDLERDFELKRSGGS